MFTYTDDVIYFFRPSPLRSLSTIDRLNTMSPAARRLATQKLKIDVTPSPLSRRPPSRTPSIGVKTPHTPRFNTPGGSSSRSSDAENVLGLAGPDILLTDNLLKLPLQRQRAADFFKN